MGFLSDLLLAGGAFGAAVYCLVLSRRLRALTGLDSTLGNAIAVLSGQVDELSRALQGAESAAFEASARLDGQTSRAEALAARLELLSAALHDVAEPAPAAPGISPFTRHSLSEPRSEAPTSARSRILRRRPVLAGAMV